MRQLKLTNDGYALVSEEDYDFLSQWKWHLSSTGYVLRNIDLKKMHRLILSVKKGEYVDHRNRIKHDNTRENIHIVTIEENIHNQSKKKGTKNKYKGTTFKKKLNAWEARCRMYGEDFYLGMYKTEKTAGYAYNKKALELNPNTWVNEFIESVEELEKLIVEEKLIFEQTDKKSRYPNVYYIKITGKMIKEKWAVIFRVNNKNKYFGRYDTEEEAYSKVIEVSAEFDYKLSKKLTYR